MSKFKNNFIIFLILKITLQCFKKYSSIAFLPMYHKFKFQLLHALKRVLHYDFSKKKKIVKQ